jgi:hypothetical protein
MEGSGERLASEDGFRGLGSLQFEVPARAQETGRFLQFLGVGLAIFMTVILATVLVSLRSSPPSGWSFWLLPVLLYSFTCVLIFDPIYSNARWPRFMELSDTEARLTFRSGKVITIPLLTQGTEFTLIEHSGASPDSNLDSQPHRYGIRFAGVDGFFISDEAGRRLLGLASSEHFLVTTAVDHTHYPKVITRHHFRVIG